MKKIFTFLVGFCITLTTYGQIGLCIEQGTDTHVSNGGGYLIAGALDTYNVGLDNNEIMARNNGTASNLGINYDGGSVTMGGPTPAQRFYFVDGKFGFETASPDSKLHILGGTDVNAANGGYIINGDLNSFNLGIDNNEIQARNNGAVSNLALQYDGGTMTIGGPAINNQFRFINGNFGKGINIPVEDIDIVNSGWADMILSSTGTSGSSIRLATSRPDLTQSYYSASAGSGNKGWNISAFNENSSDVNARGNLNFRYWNDATWVNTLYLHKTGNVGIGTTFPSAKLHVSSNENNTTCYFTNGRNGTGSKYSIKAETNAASAGTLYAVYGRSTAGLYNQVSYGVYGEAFSGNGTKYGVYGKASATLGTLYGVYGTVSGGNMRYAGYFNGDLNYTGLLNGVSDKKFKEKIENLEGALYKIMQLKPKSYLYKKFKDFNFAKGKQFGFIAQELQKEFPELVTENVQVHLNENNESIGKTEYLGISYINLIPILTKGIQEQQEQIENQNDKINDQQIELEEKDQQIANLTDRLSSLESAVEQLLAQQKDEEGQVGNLNKPANLLQNQPNPFNENTQIHYFVPSKVQKAQLQITTIDGKVLDNFPLKNGNSFITLNARQLAAGNYIYTLIVDGQIVESKQMVLTK